MAVDTLARAIAAGKVPVDAYEMAVAGGYTGTKEEFEADMGNSGTNATNAANAAAEAEASAATASAAAGNLAPAYSSSATYAVGDHVLYDGGYYVCNTAITTAEAWTAAHWTAAKVGPEITDLKNAGKTGYYKLYSSSDFQRGWFRANIGVDTTVGGNKSFCLGPIAINAGDMIYLNPGSLYVHMLIAQGTTKLSDELGTFATFAKPSAQIITISTSGDLWLNIRTAAKNADSSEIGYEDIDTFLEYPITLGLINKEDIKKLNNNLITNDNILIDKTNIINGFEITFESGYRDIRPSNFNPDVIIADTNYETVRIPAVEDDKFIITGKSPGSTIHLFAAVLENGTSGGITPLDVDWENHIYTCPSNTASVVFNKRLNTTQIYDIYKVTIPDRVSALEIKTNAIESGNINFDIHNNANILLLGDSITRGVGSSDYDPTGEEIPGSGDPAQKRNIGTKSWAAKFADLVTTKYSGQCVNNGVSQYKTKDLLDNIDQLIPANTKMVILTVGTNDRNASYSTLDTNVRNLITAIKNKNIKLFVFSPIPFSGATGSLGMEKINNIFMNACKDLSVPFYSMFSEFSAFIGENNYTLSNYFADSLHPNDAGHNLMFNIYRKSLKI